MGARPPKFENIPFKKKGGKKEQGTDSTAPDLSFSEDTTSKSEQPAGQPTPPENLPVESVLEYESSEQLSEEAAEPKKEKPEQPIDKVLDAFEDVPKKVPVPLKVEIAPSSKERKKKKRGYELDPEEAREKFEQARETLNANLVAMVEDLEKKGKTDRSIEEIQGQIYDVYDKMIFPRIQKGERIEGILSGQETQDLNPNARKFFEENFVLFEKMAGWQRVLQGAGQAGQKEKTTQGPKAETKVKIEAAPAGAGKPKQEQSVRGEPEPETASEKAGVEKEEEMPARIETAEEKKEKREKVPSFWEAQRQANDKAMVERVLEHYSEEFKVKKETKDYIKEILEKDLKALKSEIEEAQMHRLRDWFDDNRQLLAEQGIIPEDVEVGPGKKEELALRAGALQEVSRENDWLEHHKLQALQMELEKDALLPDIQILLLDLLNDKSVSVRQGIERVVGQEREKLLEKGIPEYEISAKMAEVRVKARTKEVENLLKARQEIAEKLTGLNFQEKSEWEANERLNKGALGAESKEQYTGQIEFWAAATKIFGQEWQQLSEEQRGSYGALENFARQRLDEVKEDINKRMWREVYLEDEAVLGLLRQGYDLKKTTAVVRPFFIFSRKKVKTFKGGDKKILSLTDFRNLLGEAQESLNKEVTEELGKQWDNLCKDFQREIMENQIDDAVRLAPDVIAQKYERLQQRIETEEILKYLVEVDKTKKKAKELKAIEKEFGGKDVNTSEVLSGILRRDDVWEGLNDDSAPEEIAGTLSDYLEGFGFFGLPDRAATEKNKSQFKKKASKFFGSQVPQYKSACQQGIGFMEFFTNSLCGIFGQK